MFLTVGLVLFAQNEKVVLGLRHRKYGACCGIAFHPNSLRRSFGQKSHQRRVNKSKSGIQS